MPMFHKPKQVVIQPKICHRCRERMGAVPIQALSVAAGSEEDLWLCAECAWAFRRNTPLYS